MDLGRVKWFRVPLHTNRLSDRWGQSGLAASSYLSLTTCADHGQLWCFKGASIPSSSQVILTKSWNQDHSFGSWGTLQDRHQHQGSPPFGPGQKWHLDPGSYRAFAVFL